MDLKSGHFEGEPPKTKREDETEMLFTFFSHNQIKLLVIVYMMDLGRALT